MRSANFAIRIMAHPPGVPEVEFARTRHDVRATRRASSKAIKTIRDRGYTFLPFSAAHVAAATAQLPAL